MGRPSHAATAPAACLSQTWISQRAHSRAAHLVHGSDSLGGLLTIAVAYEAKTLGLASVIAHDLQEAGSESATQGVSSLPASLAATLASTPERGKEVPAAKQLDDGTSPLWQRWCSQRCHHTTPCAASGSWPWYAAHAGAVRALKNLPWQSGAIPSLPSHVCSRPGRSYTCRAC